MGALTATASTLQTLMTCDKKSTATYPNPIINNLTIPESWEDQSPDN